MAEIIKASGAGSDTSKKSSKRFILFSGKPFKLPAFLRLRRHGSHRRNTQEESPSISSKEETATTATATVVGPLRKSRSSQYLEIFKRIDLDGDGKISSEELSELFRTTGANDSPEIVPELIDYEEFKRIMKKEEDGSSDEIRRAFEMYETEKGSGVITADGLRNMLRRLGDVSTTHEDCMRMISAYDIDGNGVMDYHEFHQMMMT